MGFLRRHWLTIIGLISNLPSIWRGLVWIFDWEIRVETALQKLDQLGGVGGVIEFLVNPPPWLALVTLPVGLGLIWLDFRRGRASLAVTPAVYDQKAALIKNARQLVIDATARDGAATDFRTALERSSAYLQLRPHLSAGFLESVRSAGRSIIVPPHGSNLPGLAHVFLNELDRIERGEIPAPAAQIQRTPPRPARRAKIVFGDGHPFETVARSGVNMSRTVRVKIENDSDVEITGGMLQLEDLDPPNRGHKDFLLRNQIRIGVHGQEYVDVAVYPEGSSEAKPGHSIILIVPPASGAFFGPLPHLIPVGSYMFHLKFSSLEGGKLARAFCRLSVENNILRLQDWGDAAKILLGDVKDQEISLMEAVTRTWEAIKDRPISIVIEHLADSPDDILTWLCNSMTRYENGKEPLVKLRGNKPPSRVKEEIYMAPLSGYDFIVEGQTIVMRERNGRLRYESLSVSTAEVDGAIQELSSRDA
jgi:hypothetical protein